MSTSAVQYFTNKTNKSSNTVHFDDVTALHLSQAFNLESDLQHLLALMLSQLKVLCGVHGLHYQHSALDTQYMLGSKTHHSAEYNLEFSGIDLGTLRLLFPRRQREQEIETAEDLLSLAFTALRNAVTLAMLQNRIPLQTAAPTNTTQDESREDKSDTLILVRLDHYDSICSNDGGEWAQTLMTSVRQQIEQGLRQADGIYQIDENTIAVLLPLTTLDQAHEVALKVRVLVASLHLSAVDVTHQLTACMGISDAKHVSCAEDVMANARTALAAALMQGNNQIEIFNPSVEAVAT
ncbi:MAG: diguanylate cyclase [Gammaproteobacteria bacterium]|nr:diguanylate cyclase [Gammaproteobacteria bacterium]